MSGKSRKSYHIPNGDPCTNCGRAASSHRVSHTPVGDPCEKCGLATNKHQKRFRDGKPSRRKHTWDSEPIQYIGIDGEGQGRLSHRYVMLAASTADGSKEWLIEGYSLSTKECLDLILELPTYRTKIFSYSFNYDLTMMLRDLDNLSLWRLFRPETRARAPCEVAKGPVPVRWGEYSLNLQGTKFTVRKGTKRIVIWDLFKFFQGKFVAALKDWKVGTPELWERMARMKDKRAEFDKESADAVRAYCLEECRCMAQLAGKLIDAHEKAELHLTSFYGAGSTGAAILNKLEIREKLKPTPHEMRDAVASAFFGGRFENSVIGAFEEHIYNRDISSAYPYHTTFLPCLEHATWRLTHRRSDLDTAKCALVNYSLGRNPGITSWGPFPFRTDDGSISFPIESGGGWIWRDEYLEGEKLFSHVEFREAWIHSSECDCRPFEKIPEYYLYRLRVGKEGPGIVIKLAINSVYGKLAQSIGNALFNSWIWAGLVTSGCRAQVLAMLGLHKNWANLLAVATDGIFTREVINAPTPKDTGTDIRVIDQSSGKEKHAPLGGWETKDYSRGLFFARPGIYFPLNPTIDDIKDIRGRGVGKGVVYENWNTIMRAWDSRGIEGIARVANVSRFCGAKTSINRTYDGCRRADAKGGVAPHYANWITRKVEMSFDPMPKRQEMNADGRTLKLRTFPKDLRSIPYNRALLSKEHKLLKMMHDELIEQPDADLTEYEGELYNV